MARFAACWLPSGIDRESAFSMFAASTLDCPAVFPPALVLVSCVSAASTSSGFTASILLGPLGELR